MNRTFTTILIILILILLILLLLWFFRRKKRNDACGKHEKAETLTTEKKPAAGGGTPEAADSSEKVPKAAELKATDAVKPAESAVKAIPEDQEEVYKLFCEEAPAPAAEALTEDEAPAEEVPAEEDAPAVEDAPAEEIPVKEVPVRNSFPMNEAVQRDSALKSLDRFSRVIAINIETPNNEHDSICNIGITIGDTEKCLSTNVTVNPEEPIDDVPDGMTAEEIQNSPTLKELWPGMSKLLAGSLVIAHNASYDLTILKKALKTYGLEVPEFYQACTYRMSRKFHPEFDSYKLGSICEIYQIPLDVKNAVSHSDACFDIFCRLADEGKPVFQEAKLFTMD